jgi:hypothetical protein
MAKNKEGFPVPVDIKVSQPGSVLATNARPLESPMRFGANPGSELIRADHYYKGEPGEFEWPSHTDGRKKSDG